MTTEEFTARASFSDIMSNVSSSAPQLSRRSSTNQALKAQEFESLKAKLQHQKRKFEAEQKKFEAEQNSFMLEQRKWEQQKEKRIQEKRRTFRKQPKTN